jgi:hypothetical protein
MSQILVWMVRLYPSRQDLFPPPDSSRVSPYSFSVAYTSFASSVLASLHHYPRRTHDSGRALRTLSKLLQLQRRSTNIGILYSCIWSSPFIYFTISAVDTLYYDPGQGGVAGNASALIRTSRCYTKSNLENTSKDISLTSFSLVSRFSLSCVISE